MVGAGVGAGLLLSERDTTTAPAPSTRPVAAADQGGKPPASTPRANAASAVAVVRGSAARRTAVPILMYHVLGTPPASAPLPELWVSKARFREQMAALSEAGFQAITLKAVFAGWKTGGPLPRKPVVVSFDDGYLSHATVAAPTLRRYGWPGVLNLAVQDLGADGLPRHLAQEMVREGWSSTRTPSPTRICARSAMRSCARSSSDRGSGSSNSSASSRASSATPPASTTRG